MSSSLRRTHGRKRPFGARALLLREDAGRRAARANCRGPPAFRRATRLTCQWARTGLHEAIAASSAR